MALVGVPLAALLEALLQHLGLASAGCNGQNAIAIIIFGELAAMVAQMVEDLDAPMACCRAACLRAPLASLRAGPLELLEVASFCRDVGKIRIKYVR